MNNETRALHVELLPCPFCGAKASATPEMFGSVIHCQHLYTCPLDGHEELAAAENEWNTRAQPADQQGDIYESHAIVAAAYKQLLSALGNEEMSHSDALAASSAKPATAKVVLPERMPGITHTDSHEEGWNACLDEVAKLNGGQS